MGTIKILILIKEIISTEEKLNLENLRDNASLEKTINLYDEYAIEEGIKLREKFGGEVILCTVGKKEVRKTLNLFMSMGADKVEIIEESDLSGKNIAKKLFEHIEKNHGDFDIILGGHQGIDRNRGEVPGRLSSKLNVPFINIVSNIEIVNENTIICKREIEDGIEVLKSRLPLVVTVQRGINTPRYPELKKIFSDKSKLIEIIENENKEEEHINIYPRDLNKKVQMIEGLEPKEAVKELIRILKENKAL